VDLLPKVMCSGLADGDPRSRASRAEAPLPLAPAIDAEFEDAVIQIDAAHCHSGMLRGRYGFNRGVPPDRNAGMRLCGLFRLPIMPQ
jgi:hypothetical protein